MYFGTGKGGRAEERRLDGNTTPPGNDITRSISGEKDGYCLHGFCREGMSPVAGSG